MPHYKDGTESKVGDVAKGKPYNTDHEVIGVVVDVRPGDACNLSIAFATTPAPYASNVLAVASGSSPNRVPVELRIDYGATADFEKVR